MTGERDSNNFGNIEEKKSMNKKLIKKKTKKTEERKEKNENRKKKKKKYPQISKIGDRIDVLSLSKPMELLIEARATEQSEVTKVFSVQLDRSSVPGSLSNFYNHQAVPS